MPSQEERDERKSAMSLGSNASMLMRWKSFARQSFAPENTGDPEGRGSCENGFEGHWKEGVPSVRPRQFSKSGNEGWPRAMSNMSKPGRRAKHTRFPSSQAMSSGEGLRIVYGQSAEEPDVDSISSGRPSLSRNPSMRRSSDGDHVDVDELIDDEDDEMGLASRRRSKRYSQQKSPLSPTFGFSMRDRVSESRLSKSILKRESIRLSALPPMPQESPAGEARRSFPAGHGLAPLMSNPHKLSPESHSSYRFPAPSGAEGNMRSPLTPKFVDWNGALDPARPDNTPMPVKLSSTFLLLALTFSVTFASATLTPASARISQGFATTPEVITLASSLSVLGFALGAPFFAALNERYGRKLPLLSGIAIFTIFNVPVAITANLPTLLGFRFFAGLFGAAPLIIAPAALGDLWSPVGRGIALSFFAVATVIGAVVGAVAGGYLAVETYPGWRWTAWMAVGLSAFFGLPLALLYTESSAPVLLQRKARNLRAVTKDWSFHAESEEDRPSFGASLLKTAVLLGEPTLLLPTIHMSFVCGLLNLLFVSYGYAFETERHWLHGAGDLSLLPVIFGCLVGIFVNFIVSKKKYTAVFRNDGSAPPEARLIPWIIGSWILPIGLLVFAWTSDADIIFVPQLMAGVPTGIGISLVLIGGLNYLVDTYAALPSLVVGANTFVRCALAFAFPLFAPHMYESLGVEWAGTTLAIVAVVLIPIPIVLMKVGPRLRGVGRFAVKARGPGGASQEDVGAEMTQRGEIFSVTVEGGSPTTVMEKGQV